MPQFFMITFGCQMNHHDSDRIAGTLLAAGYGEASELGQANLVMLNTCSVREKAEQKLRSEVGRLQVLKRDRPELRIGVAGCVAQQEGARLLKAMPAIDLIIGPDNISELPDILARLELGGPAEVRAEFDLAQPRFLASHLLPHTAKPTAYVTTMKGCNERCSFCIVPTTRGPERYRAALEIVEEVRGLAKKGVKEVTLLGQTVNSYQDHHASLADETDSEVEPWQHTRPVHARSDESSFSALLRAIASEVPELRRLRYVSPHPRHLTRRLIRAHRELPVLAKHVHLPVQSGSDRVLKRMLRRYRRAEYLERVAALRGAVPGVTLSTDVIVGFPGETRTDFDATLSLLGEVGFAGVFAFKYSPRPGTPALRLAGEVSEEEKALRLAELLNQVDTARRAHLQSLVGTLQRVLFEGVDRFGNLSGRSEQNEIVHAPGSLSCVGEIFDVRIVEAFKNSLAGELLEAASGGRRSDRQAERHHLKVVV